MDRRNFVKTVGGIGAASAIGVGSYALSGGASAAGGFENVGTVQISSDDGSVEYVAFYGDSEVDWSGFENEAKSFSIAIDLSIEHPEHGELTADTIHETGVRELIEDWGGTGEGSTGKGTSGTISSTVGLDENGNHDSTTDWHIVGTDDDGYGLPSNPLPASALEVDDDGSTVTYTLIMASTYTWYDEVDGGEQLFEETFTSQMDVEVENKPKMATASNPDGEDGVTGA